MIEKYQKNSYHHDRNAKVGRGSGIDYETTPMSPKKDFVAHFGNRYEFKHSSYWLDGKIILVGYLIEKMREEKTALQKAKKQAE